MKRPTLVDLAIVVGAVIACSSPAFAQNASRSDMAYCQRLIDIYIRYIGGDDYGPRRAAVDKDVEARVAIAKCQEGDTATGIPILERKLRNNRFSLPSRN